MIEIFPNPGTTPKPTLDKAHIWRSRFIDQASKCEGELRLLFARTHPSAKASSFKTMAETLCSVTALTDSQNKRLAKICEALLPLIALRANIAHSELGLAVIDDEHFITLANASGRLLHGRVFLALTQDEFKTAQKDMANLANQLSQFRVTLK